MGKPRGYREGSIGRRDEQDEVGARYEVGRQSLVLADDRVGTGRVDDVQIAEERNRSGDSTDAVGVGCLANGVAIP